MLYLKALVPKVDVPPNCLQTQLRMSLLIALSHVAAGHMSLVRPGPARNAIDRNLQLFKDNPWW